MLFVMRVRCGCRKVSSRQASKPNQQGRQMAAGAAPAAVKGLPLSWLDIFVLSALAKIGATLVTYPLLVVKNRLQVGVDAAAWLGGGGWYVCTLIGVERGMKFLSPLPWSPLLWIVGNSQQHLGCFQQQHAPSSAL